MTKREAASINCFALVGRYLRPTKKGGKTQHIHVCQALEIAPTYETCKKCKFRKPLRDETKGKFYAPTMYMENLRAPEGPYIDPEDANDWQKQNQEFEREAKATEARLREEDKPCPDCMYWQNRSMCTYLVVEGKRRPCKADKCKELGIFVPKEKARFHTERGGGKRLMSREETENEEEADQGGQEEEAVLREIEEEETAIRLRERYHDEI